jgi:hypothetical protein
MVDRKAGAVRLGFWFDKSVLTFGLDIIDWDIFDDIDASNLINPDTNTAITYEILQEMGTLLHVDVRSTNELTVTIADAKFETDAAGELTSATEDYITDSLNAVFGNNAVFFAGGGNGGGFTIADRDAADPRGTAVIANITSHS